MNNLLFWKGNLIITKESYLKFYILTLNTDSVNVKLNTELFKLYKCFIYNFLIISFVLTSPDRVKIYLSNKVSVSV